jgi:hypothetical protein
VARSCAAVTPRRWRRTTLPPGRAGAEGRQGRQGGPADRAPYPAPPYRGVRGVRGSTVGGAHTAHAWSARFHARFVEASTEGAAGSSHGVPSCAPPSSLLSGVGVAEDQ